MKPTNPQIATYLNTSVRSLQRLPKRQRERAAIDLTNGVDRELAKLCGCIQTLCARAMYIKNVHIEFSPYFAMSTGGHYSLSHPVAGQDALKYIAEPFTALTVDNLRDTVKKLERFIYA